MAPYTSSSLRWLVLGTLVSVILCAPALALDVPSAPAAPAPEPSYEPPVRLPPGPLPVLEDPTAMVEYDVLTGEVRTVSSKDPSQLPDVTDLGRVEPQLPTDLLEQGADDAEPESVIGADGRIRVTPTADFPWRSIVKLYMTFPDGQYMCSGTFVDEDHVLTAGHCIHDNAQTPSFATDVWVVPGMDDGFSTSSYDDRPLRNNPYSAARVTGMRTYTAWTSSKDPDHDWAVLTLDRPLGSYTGWMGRMWAESGNDMFPWYTGIINAAGYPGDRDSGRNMYFDSDVGCAVTTNRHFYGMDTAGGQSGMPVWYRQPAESGGISRYVMTVHAYGVGTGDCGNSGTRLNQDKFDRINTWRNDDAAVVSKPDLFQKIPNGALRSAPTSTESTISDTKLSANEVVTITTTLRNGGTSASGAFHVNFYLSTNTIISTADRFIGSQSVSSIAALGDRTVTFVRTLPSNVSAGAYYVGWIIDSAGVVSEYDETDNVVLMRAGSANVQVTVDRTLPGTPAPDDGVASWSTATSRTFTWPSVADATGISAYRWRLDGGAETTIGNVTSVTLSGLTPGVRNFSIRAVDGAGNVGPYGHHLAYVDNVAPPAPLAIGPGWTSDATPRIFVAVGADVGSGVAGLESTIDGASWTDLGIVSFFDLPTLAAGDWTVQVRAYDGVGLRSAATSLLVRVDAVAPTAPTDLAATLSGGWTNDNTPAFTWTAASDAHSGVMGYQYRLDDALDWTPLGDVTGLTLPTVDDGAHVLRVRAVDNAGLVSPPAELAFSVDTAAPTPDIQITPPTPDGNNDYYISWVHINVSATDAGSGVASVACSINSTAVACSPDTPVSVGQTRWYRFRVIVTDNAGNQLSTTRIVKIDRIDPHCNVDVAGTTDGSGNFVGSATVFLNATDVGSAVASVEYQLNGGSRTSYSGPFSVGSGTYTVRCHATDLAGKRDFTDRTFQVV